MKKVLVVSGFALAVFVAAGCASVPKRIAVVDPASVGYQIERSAINSWQDAVWPGGQDLFYAITGNGPQGPRLAFLAKTNTQEVVIVDGRREQEYDEVNNFGFTDDGRHYAYIARTGTKLRVVLDGNPQMEFDEVGSAMVWPHSQGANTIVTASPYYYGYSRWLISFTEDGKHSLYAGRNGKKWTVVVDGKALPEFEGTLVTIPQLSPDAKHLLYVVNQDQRTAGQLFMAQLNNPGAPPPSQCQRAFVFIDGQPIAQSDRMFGPWPKFDSQGQLDYFGGTKGGMIERIKLAPERK